MIWRMLVCTCMCALLVLETNAVHSVEELTEFVKNTFENETSKQFYDQNVAEWNYATDISDENNENLVNVTLASSKKSKEIYDEWFKDANLDDIKDETIKRQVKKEKNIGKAALDEADLENLTKIGNKMTDIYSTGKICPFDKQDCDLPKEGLSLEPGIETIMSSSRNYDELTYAWKAWRDATGAKIRTDYQTYVNLVNKAAKLNGFEDNGEMWRSDYETESFVEDMDKNWDQVVPLYNCLHDYVRTKLIDLYGADKIGKDGLIPANVLGNMWAQSWVNLAKDVRPYPSASQIDVTAALKEQNYTVLKLFETSNEFYMSLGLPTNEVSYGEGSMIEKPNDREVLCHASAWDFSDKKTYRIKMCTEVDYEYFVTIHHEMGHIQYFILYKDQPVTFRDGANPGFHEAVGDTIALSVATPKHLEKVNLLTNYENTPEAKINSLMDMALERVAFLPFGLLIDKFRWDVFSQNVTQDKWNEHWWKYRKQYQKVKPPVDRSENDFDAGSKFHVAGDSQYINYFVAHVLEFQLYRSLCITAGQYNPDTKDPPLHECDFFENTDVGDKLKAGLSLGSSKHWSEVLMAMTGEDELDASAIMEYFDPLLKFFEEKNPNCKAIN